MEYSICNHTSKGYSHPAFCSVFISKEISSHNTYCQYLKIDRLSAIQIYDSNNQRDSPCICSNFSINSTSTLYASPN